MKILFIGSLINSKTLDSIVEKSRVKPSNAPVNFENMLVKGLEASGGETSVLSVPTVSTFPGGCLLGWKNRTEFLDFGKKVKWIPCINLLGLKQICIEIGSYWGILRWAFKNRKEKDKVIMNYSVYPPYSKATQIMGKLLGIKTCCIVTDLPEYLYKMGKSAGIKKILNDYYSKKMVKYQSRYDSYVFLTEHMASRMGLEHKPSILMEGFSDPSIFEGINDVNKNSKPTVMYAGRLSEDFNIKSLVDGFMQVNGDFRLWLFGSGDMVDYIKECEKKDHRIHYFGKVDRQILLEHQKSAHLLVSVKSPEEDHANYAFPSKILEYMTSGTAVASTRVGGIPREYFDYIYPIDRFDEEGIRDAIQELLSLDKQFLCEKGISSMLYALDSKSYSMQCKRIYDFLRFNLFDN